MTEERYEITPIGWVGSPLTSLGEAPRQADEGAPEAVIAIRDEVRAAIDGLSVGDEVVVLTWLDRGDRDVLAVHPRGDNTRPVIGVFATRSPDRPNPIGLHTTRIVAIDGTELRVSAIEAIDGTPVIDIKPALGAVHER